MLTTSDGDADFGQMRKGIDSWDCRVKFDFPHPPTQYFAVHVWASDSGPSKIQRQALRRLKKQYTTLWPSITSTIVGLHPTINENAQVEAAMREWVSVHLGEHQEDSIELVYDLDLPDEGTRGFFIRLEDDGIVEAVIAE